jgi:hypothetical protein
VPNGGGGGGTRAPVAARLLPQPLHVLHRALHAPVGADGAARRRAAAAAAVADARRPVPARRRSVRRRVAPGLQRLVEGGALGAGVAVERRAVGLAADDLHVRKAMLRLLLLRPLERWRRLLACRRRLRLLLLERRRRMLGLRPPTAAAAGGAGGRGARRRAVPAATAGRRRRSSSGQRAAGAVPARGQRARRLFARLLLV